MSVPVDALEEAVPVPVQEAAEEAVPVPVPVQEAAAMPASATIAACISLQPVTTTTTTTTVQTTTTRTHHTQLPPVVFACGDREDAMARADLPVGEVTTDIMHVEVVDPAGSGMTTATSTTHATMTESASANMQQAPPSSTLGHAAQLQAHGQTAFPLARLGTPRHLQKFQFDVGGVPLVFEVLLLWSHGCAVFVVTCYLL